VYVVAPLAVRVAVCPAHIVAEFTETIGFGLTVTITDVVPGVAQPVTVPLRFTVIVEVGVNVNVVPDVVPVWVEVHV
jgi:hypothetical protein